MELNWIKRIFWHFLKLMVLQSTPQANSVQILSRGHSIMVNAGQSMTLECQVYAESYNLFFNPVVWHKTQHPEECPISIMVKTKQPFASDPRFKPSYAPPSPSMLKYIFELSINNITVEDSGNYSCQIYGPFNSVLASVTYYVLVRVHPQQIMITSRNFLHHRQHTSAIEDKLVVTEKKNITVGCTVVGGYPPADVEMYTGHRNVTNRFSIARTSRIVGSRCMRAVEQVIEIWSHSVTVSAEDDGSQLKCIVSVPGLPPNITSIPLVVRFTPVIDCLPARASVGDAQLNLTCMVKARPEVTSLYWTIRGLNVSDRQLNNEFYTSVRHSPDGVLESKLYIRNVTSDNFHTYTIIAENVIGVNFKDVVLKRKFLSQTSTTREIFLVGMELLQNGSSGEISVLSRTINSQEVKSIFDTFLFNSAFAVLPVHTYFVSGVVFTLTLLNLTEAIFYLCNY